MMDTLYWIKNVIICLDSALVGFINKYVDKLCSVKESEDMYKCYFLFEKGVRGYETKIEKVYNMLDIIVEFINEAKETVDMCFYLITDLSIVSALVQAKNRNVRVRVVTDFTSGIINNKFARFLYRAGIPVYTKQANPGRTIMHHKFSVRDGITVLQCSMNLTKNTTKGSFDNIMLTHERDMVEPCIQQFQILTTKFNCDVF